MDKLTQDEINAALVQAGLKPGMGTVELHDDDTVSVRPIPTEDRGALETFGRRLAGGLPKAAGAAVGMGLGSGMITAGAAGGAAVGTVAGLPGQIVGGLVGGAIPAAAAGGTGAEVADFLDNNTLKIREKMLGNRAQQIRDESSHPWATTAGDFGADLMAFGPPSRALASGAAKLGTAARWARGAMRLAPEESQALVSHGANALLGAGQSAAQQYSDSGTVDPMLALKHGALGSLVGNPGDTIKGLRSLRGAKPPVMAPSVQSPSAPPAPTTADAPWTGRVSAGQDMAPAEIDLNVNNDRTKGTLAGKIADVRDQRREGDVKIAQQAFKAGDQLTADQGEFVRQRLLAELAAQEQTTGPIGPQTPKMAAQMTKAAEAKRAAIMALKPEELAQFRDDIAAREKAQADERTAAEMAPTTADIAAKESDTIRKNVQNWKRPTIPTEPQVVPQSRGWIADTLAKYGGQPNAPATRQLEPVPVPEPVAEPFTGWSAKNPAPVAPSTADPIRENTANELRQALIGGQITGAPPTPRPQKTRFSRPEEVGPDRGLPTEGPRTEAETLQDYLENRRTKFQTRPKSEAADAPTPEPAGVLAEAVRLAADPKAGKKAAFIPAGSPRPEVAPGLVSLAHPKGEFIYNPAKMSAEEAARAVAGDQLDGQALGLGQSTKPTAPSDHSVVTDSNGQPAVMTEVVAGPQDVARAKLAQQIAAPGSTQRVVLTADVLAGREAGLAPALPPSLAAAPRPPSDPTAARPASSLPASSPVADALYQKPKEQPSALESATPESIALGRRALDRRGFKYTETTDPIDEGRAAGSFEPATGDITVSKQNAAETTYHHEGMHGQLQSLMLSKNPRERQFAIDLIAAHGEEPLAEQGARASIAGSKENRFLRLVKDNWNWLRTTKLGGGDATPERAARLLAESFDFDAPGAVPTGVGGAKFQDSKEAPVKEGFVRLYHGGNDKAAGFDFTPDLNYADGYRSMKQGEGKGAVWQVDVPENAPFLNRETGVKYDRNGNDIATLVNGQKLPEEYVNQAKKLDSGTKFQPSQQDTPEFKKWFGSSKVIDEQGKPLTVYHGTSKDVDFNAFRGNKNGIWFTPNPEGASKYAVQNDSMGFSHGPGWKVEPTNTASRVIPAQLSLKNPKTFEVWPDSIRLATNYKKALGEFFTELKTQGHDGVIFGSGNDKTYVAFEPTQVKSAIGNRGTFDPAKKDIRYQPVTTNHEGVPNSVFAKADALYPGMAERLGAYEGTKAKHYGLFNSAIGELQKQGPLVDSVALKMQEAHATGRAPALTPEEIPVYDRLTKVMQESAATATAAGRPITPQANYFPHILNVPEARAYEKAPDAYLAAKTKEFVDWNLNNFAPARGATPVEAAQYFKDYMHGVSSAPGSLGSDFGALNKSARQFGLPPSMREPSALNALHRYGSRYSVDLAKKQEILDHPDFANALGLGDKPVPTADQQAMKDAALHVNNALAQVGENPNGREAKDLLNAGRQLVHSATMQTATAVRNQVNLAQHLVHMDKPEHFAQFVSDTVRAVTDYKDQYAKTLAMSVNKPGVDPSANVSDLAGKVASKLRGAATDLRKMTLGQFFENVSRVRNYTVAEGRARLDLALAATGDKSAQSFLDKFGAGVDTKQPFEEQVARVAKNYVDSMEGTYSGAGLPASVVNSGARSQFLRIQRYPIEQMSRAYQYTIRPIQKDGNYAPLLMYLFGSALNAVALQKFNQALSGGVSGLVSEDEAKAAGANPQKEMLLNLMDLAGTANLYGFAGNAAQAVSRNLRGQPQAIFGDPTVNYMTTTYKNLFAAVDAVKRGEPVIPSLLEAGRRITLEQMQMTRGLGQDKEQAGDKKLKAKHAYLTDRKDKSAVEMAGGLLTGNTFNYQVPQISPSRDKAIAGDRQAYLAQPPATRRRLDNYPGGYESTADQANLETWLAASHPERLADYIHRRQAFKDRVHGREQGR